MLMYASSDWNLRDFMNRQAGGQTQFDMTTQMYRACSCLRLRNDRKPAVTSPIGRSIVLRHHAGRRLCSITSTTIHWIMWIHAIPATTASRCGKLPTKGRTQRKHGCFFGRLSKQERYGKGGEEQESAHKLSIARVSHLSSLISLVLTLQLQQYGMHHPLDVVSGSMAEKVTSKGHDKLECHGIGT